VIEAEVAAEVELEAEVAAEVELEADLPELAVAGEAEVLGPTQPVQEASEELAVTPAWTAGRANRNDQWK